MGDNQYQSLWSGANLLDTLFLLITICMMFTFFFVRMMVPFTLLEATIWLFVGETYILGFIILRYKLREKHRAAVRGLKFCYAGVWRDFTYYEKMLFGIKQWYKIDIDWSDKMLKELFNDTIFKGLQREIENWQKIEAFQRPIALPKIQFDTEDDVKAAQRKAEEVINTLPYRSFEIQEVSDVARKKLKQFKIYIGILSEAMKYGDSELEFDRICLLTDSDIAHTLKTKADFAVHEDYPVEIDQVECAFVQLGWLLPEIPVYLLSWSENITKQVLESSLDSQSITYIQLKVLEKFVYNLRAFNQQAAMTIKQEQTKVDVYFDAYDGLIQDVEEMAATKLLGSGDIQRLKLQDKAARAGTWKMISIFLIILLVILIFVLVLSYIPTNLTPIIPQGASVLQLISNNIL